MDKQRIFDPSERSKEMKVIYRINAKLRRKLQSPFGLLIKGFLPDNKDEIEKILQINQPPILISVGDIVSRDLSKNQFNPKLIIIDNKCMRKKIEPKKFSVEKIFRAKNPPGTITDEATKAIREALESNKRAQIVIDGEEDLLVLIVILHAPKNAFVIYGQPNEGIVLIKVTEKRKEEVRSILKDMKTFRKAK